MSRKRIFDIIQIGNRNDLPSRAFDIFISAVIILNIAAMFMDTFSELAGLHELFSIVETVTVIIFCVEYALRIFTADLLFPGKSRPRAVLSFLLSFDGIIDLLTILPFFFLDGFVIFRILRVVRILHLFRLNAQHDSFHIITKVLKMKKNQIISSVFIIIVLMFASSLGIYGAEHEAQPEVFSNAFSGIWWSMSTLLTVGYGDIYPVTIAGRIMGIIIAFLGVGAVAIPTGIISAGFVEYYSREENADKRFINITEVGEVLVGKNSEFIGLNPKDADERYGVTVHLIIRGKLSVIPTRDIVFEENDILIVNTDKLLPENRAPKRRNRKK